MKPIRRSGFTLLELSVVLALIAVVIGGGLVILTSSVQSSQYNATVAKMDVVEKALLNFAITHNRLPCPADLTLTPTTATTGSYYNTTAGADYGFEAGADPKSSPGTGTGVCTGANMTPQANFTSGAPAAVEGGVPTRTLQLSDDYMFDAWGRKLVYAVDSTQTLAGALPTYAPTFNNGTTSSSALLVANFSGNNRTGAGAYVLLSHGANGHGGFTANGVPVNAGINNSAELYNCHCGSTTGISTYYSRNYYEMAPTNDPTDARDNFDDIVTFKEAWQLQAPNAPLLPIPIAAPLTNPPSSYGRIYVSSTSGNKTFRFDLSGNYLGTTPKNISGVAIDPGLNVWTAVSTGHRITELDPNGNTLHTWTGTTAPLNTAVPTTWFPEGLAIDNSSPPNLFVADANTNQIYQFNLTALNNTTNAGLIQKFGQTGVTTNGITDTLSAPQGITVQMSGSNEYLWVADSGNNRVVKYLVNGGTPAPVQQIPSGCNIGCANVGLGFFHVPYDIKLDRARNIWVTDSSNMLQEFSPTGINPVAFSACAGGPNFNSIQGIALDPTGTYVWIADYMNSNVLECSITAGSPTTLTYVRTLTSASPALSNPTFIAFSPLR